MSIKYMLLKATKKSFEGELAESEANMEVYLENAAGVGEHSDVMAEIKELVQKIHDAKGCIEIVDERINSTDWYGSRGYVE